jgi:hypothetical protein
MRLLNKTTLIALAVLLLPGLSAIAADTPPGRLRVDLSSGDAGDIRAHLNATAEAATAEDLEGFLACFTRASKTKICKQAALRFVQHAVTMELLDTHVIKLTCNSGQAAVHYRLALSDNQYDVVSLVALKREDGYWRIQSEKVQSYEHQSPRSCSPSRYACMGGTCRIQ